MGKYRREGLPNNRQWRGRFLTFKKEQLGGMMRDRVSLGSKKVTGKGIRFVHWFGEGLE